MVLPAVFLLASVIFVNAAAEPVAVVVLPVANLYSQPAREADVVTQAIFGTNVVILEETGDWARVRTPDDYTGWMPLSSAVHTTQPYAASGRVAEVRSLFANLYREPDVTKHAPLLVVPFETRLEIVAEPEANERRWLDVRLPDKGRAWIQRGDVAFDRGPLDIKQTIALARRFLGLPYLWGGTSSFGFDCSGFVQMLHRQRGIRIPRDAGPQSRWEGFQPVVRNKLKPGDLIFFGASPDRVTHTGMYIGRGEFIHATTHQTPVVQISRLKEAHWSELFVAARRPK
jgi:hypothetical protein